MEDGIMNKFLDMFGESSKWGQSSNTGFTQYLIDENKHLKSELLSFKTEVRKRQEELSDELTRQKLKNKELEDSIMRRNASFTVSDRLNFSDSSHSTVNGMSYFPRTTSTITSDSINLNKDVSFTSAINDVPSYKISYVPGSFEQATASTNSSSSINDVTSAVVTDENINSSYVPASTEQAERTNTVDSAHSSTYINNVAPPYIPTPITEISTSAVEINSSTSITKGISSYIPTPIDQMRRKSSVPSSKGKMDTNKAYIKPENNFQPPFTAAPTPLSLLKRKTSKQSQVKPMRQSPMRQSPISTSKRAKTDYTPTLYDGLILNISSDDER